MVTLGVLEMSNYKAISKAPWVYEYNPYHSQEGREVPNFTIHSAEGEAEYNTECEALNQDDMIQKRQPL